MIYMLLFSYASRLITVHIVYQVSVSKHMGTVLVVYDMEMYN